MLPTGLSAEEAAASQQRQRVNETLFSKDPLSIAVSSTPGLPQLKSSRSSTLSSTEDTFFTISAAAPRPASPPPGTSYRVSNEREFCQMQHGLNGNPVNSVPYLEVRENTQQQQQQDDAAASACAGGEPGETPSADSVPAASLMASEAHVVASPLIGATFESSATCERSSTSTREAGNAVFQAYKAELPTPPLPQRHPPSSDSAGERSIDTSPREGGRGTARGGPALAPEFPACSSSASTFPDSLPQAVAAAAHLKQAPPAAAAQPRAAAEVFQGEVCRSASVDKAETCSDKDRSQELHGAAAMTPAAASPRKQKAGRPRGGRSVEGEEEKDPRAVITRLDVAVEALVAHAEDQAEQIKKLTMLVEDLSLKLESLQEGLLSGRVCVHLAPPPAAELPLPPTPAAPPEVRQSRGRMIPPPLPRDKARETHLGLPDQQGYPPYMRHGNTERNAMSASYLAAQREAENEALERRRAEEQREAQRREEERLRREEEERRRREELTRRAAEEQRRREVLDEKRKNIISSLISNKGGSSLFGDDGGAASHRSLFDD